MAKIKMEFPSQEAHDAYIQTIALSDNSIGAKWAEKMAEENEDMHDRLLSVAKILRERGKK